MKWCWVTILLLSGCNICSGQQHTYCILNFKINFWGEKDQGSISESQNFSCLSARSWPRLQGIRSNVCCDMTATSQLSANALCHAHSVLAALWDPCPCHALGIPHNPPGKAATSLPLVPTTAESQPCPARWQGCPHITALHCFSLQLLVPATVCHHPLAACSQSISLLQPASNLLLLACCLVISLLLSSTQQTSCGLTKLPLFFSTGGQPHALLAGEMLFPSHTFELRAWRSFCACRDTKTSLGANTAAVIATIMHWMNGVRDDLKRSRMDKEYKSLIYFGFQATTMEHTLYEPNRTELNIISQ